MSSRNDDVTSERIDASLRRLFVPPADLAERISTGLPATPEPASPAVTRSIGPRPLRRSAALLAAVAAGLVLWFVLGRGGAPVPVEVAPAAEEAVICHVGPLFDADPPVGLPGEPDLDALYREARGFADQGNRGCSSSDDLAGALASAYGTQVEMQPGTANLLQGPFSSAEWPTGTILTGFPEDRMAVLVADLESTHTCCVHPAIPEDSSLKTFTWRVGGLVLTEITPLSEPRLLEYFQVQS